MKLGCEYEFSINKLIFFPDYFPTRTVPPYRGDVSKILILGQYIFPFKEFILNLRWIHVRNKH